MLFRDIPCKGGRRQAFSWNIPCQKEKGKTYPWNISRKEEKEETLLRDILSLVRNYKLGRNIAL